MIQIILMMYFLFVCFMQYNNEEVCKYFFYYFDSINLYTYICLYNNNIKFQYSETLRPLYSNVDLTELELSEHEATPRENHSLLLDVSEVFFVSHIKFYIVCLPCCYFLYSFVAR